MRRDRRFCDGGVRYGGRDGAPQAPLVVPDDLIAATISGVTKKAKAMGIREGMTGGRAVEIMAGTDLSM